MKQAIFWAASYSHKHLYNKHTVLTKCHEICKCDYQVKHTSVDKKTDQGKIQDYPAKQPERLVLLKSSLLCLK